MVDQVPVMGRDHFQKLGAALWSAKTVNLKIQRFAGPGKVGKIEVIPVVLDSSTRINKSGIRGYHGISLSNKSFSKPVVQHVEDSSPAAKAGLKKDDLIVKLNGTAFDSAIKVHNALFRNTTGNKISLVVKTW